MSWFPLHCHSQDSLLDGLSKPEQIVARLKECGHTGSALTDHGTLSGIPAFLDEMKKAKLKGIAGCEMYLSAQDSALRTPENARHSHLVVLAKNQRGWKNLIKASSAANRPENFYRRPRLDLNRLSSFAKGEWIVFSGHIGSDLADVCFEVPKLAYGARSYDDARSLVRKDWRDKVGEAIRRYQSLFGKENFYLEIQLIDSVNLPAARVVANILRDFGKRWGVPCVATADSHYPSREDARDHRVLLCSAFNTTMDEVRRKIDNEEDVTLAGFFKSNCYHIPTFEEMRELHEPAELAASLEIAARCESPTVTSGRPMLPVYPLLNGLTADEEMRAWCQKGWERKVTKRRHKALHADQVYHDRLQEEDGVLTTAGFSPYFLIIADVARYAREKLGCLVGEGRGSAAGCLMSYLMDITNVDPIRFDLLFSRFFNAGRLAEGHFSLPDIDMDFPIEKREAIIDYIRNKYGHDRVCQMATFTRMQGKTAVKDVLRAHNRVGFDEMNRITEHIPDEAAIADDLQAMLEEGEEPSIIRWALENCPDQLREWCHLNEDGSLGGDLSLDFEQAIRLEGTKRSQGKHASGVIISAEPLEEIAPMVWDKNSKQQIVGYDMKAAEKCGLVKFDILGTTVLDKLMDFQSLVRTGRMR